MKKIIKPIVSIVTILMVVFSLVGPMGAITPEISATSVEPELVPGNPTCQGLGYDSDYKVDPPDAGTYDVGSMGSITLVRPDDKTVDWTSTFGIDAVLVKGGPNANRYIYDPPAESFGDTGLSAPSDAELCGGQPCDVSHVSFCYDAPFCGDGTCGDEETCETCPADCGVCPPVTVNAYKVVCQTEADLPNWGDGGPDITANTAADYVVQNPNCQLASGWDFEWAYVGTPNPGDNIIGPAGSPWTTFGPTDSNGLSVTNINSLSGDRIWVREVMKEEYIPFSGDTAAPRDNVSAELYCHQDTLNYDNYDYILNPQLGNIYYCIGFNAPVSQTECTPEATTTCSTGLLGICEAGTKTCSPEGNWGSCIQDNSSTTEDCSNQLDDDCDGLIDSADPDCPVCATIEYTPDRGEDTLGLQGTYYLNSSDLDDVASSDNNRYRTQYWWGRTYYPDKYLLFGFSPNIETCETIEIENVTLYFEWHVGCTNVHYARIQVWDQSTASWVIHDLPAAPRSDRTDVLDLTSYINTPDDVNNIKIKFQGHDGGYGGYTYHDLVKLIVTKCGNCVPEPECGNGILENGEQCDDGNTTNGDGCSATCQIEVLPYCGDGVINQPSEQCDDGNTANGDGCSANCTVELVCNPEVELTIDGGFETPVVISSELWDIFTSSEVLGWNVEWNTSEPSYGGLDRPLDAYLELQRGVNGWLPQEGFQYAELDTDWDGPEGSVSNEPASAQIYQDILTIPGENYSVSFWFSPRPDTTESNNQLEFSWGGIAQPLISAAGGSQTSWTNHTYNFIATGSIARIQFANLGTSDSLGTFVDNVSVRCQLPPEPYCGDGNIDQGEECDDGNNVNGDGCSAACQIEIIPPEPFCGDGLVNQTSEQCDDGNTTNGDGCSATCQIEIIPPVPFCGDGVVNQASEQCDDGNTTSGDGCSSNCITEGFGPFCGNGSKEGSEECDDGNRINGDGCSASCTLERGDGPFCGNGILETGEECDGTAGLIEGYTCTASCTLERIICEMDVDVMMVMDVSGSMTEDSPTRLSQAKIAANNFIDNLRSGDQSGLVSFSRTATLNKALSNDHISTKSAIGGLTAGGSTNIGDAIDKANKELMSVNNDSSLAKVEILLTDGRANRPNGDGFNENPADVAFALAKSLEAAENGIMIFTIGLGSDVNTGMLQNIAENTGGKYYFSPTSNDLNEVFNQIAFETCKSIPTTYVSPSIAIFNERVRAVSDTSATVSWYTNIPATSKVVYGDQQVLALGDAPNYGYAFSTPEQDSVSKVIFHSVTISGLIPDATYYLRGVSQTAASEELTFTMLGVAEERTTTTPGLETGQAAGTTTETEAFLQEEGATTTGPGVTGEEAFKGGEAVAAVWGFVTSAIFCWILFIITILLSSWYLWLKRRGMENKNIRWILPLIVVVLLVITYFLCCEGCITCCVKLWVLVGINAVLLITSLFVKKKFIS